ncbi:Molybdenum cofactor synthesis protein 1 [Orbilia oligospora]|uniref:cyclic pyranopterin monophosphate synthase n=1 Tax=Orbilia oligospora TaxID=2813651 RepID=A0A6G1M5A6_ORBOL|nr:Molybdenum cofactor synthesis protein 1 [Orbilia oligospora]KAF3216539.1 Molybdenum cofactor synthesis protein 1 [Orbilia oligospora]KAF3245045.1 Molybdenum cofactor synthesis protein 1 [Orbilia oligospora]
MTTLSTTVRRALTGHIQATLPRPTTFTAVHKISHRKITSNAATTPVYTQNPARSFQDDIFVPPTRPSLPTTEFSDRIAAIREAKPFSEFLTDNFNRQHNYLRISITERCNLRCLYCMPEEGIDLSPPSHLLTTEEILHLAKLFVSQGVTKIRLTGGEPTVRKDIVDLITELGKLKAMGLKELAMTTNGISLARKLPQMVAGGLTALNLSLDTLDEFKFQFMTRRKGLSNVLKSIDAALSLNIQPLKVNCVVMSKVNVDEIPSFLAMTKDKPIEVRFIEYMPFTGNKWESGKMITYQEMLDQIRQSHPDLQKVQDHKNDTNGVNILWGCGPLGSGQWLIRAAGNGSRRPLSKTISNIPTYLLSPPAPHICQTVRAYSTSRIQHQPVMGTKTQDPAPGQRLTHVLPSGAAYMVPIHEKAITTRTAKAVSTIKFSNPDAVRLIRSNSNKKGDVLSISRIAGIMAAKKTSEIIPLCHPISISKVRVNLRVVDDGNGAIEILTVVTCDGKTGVEMEALTAATGAALTVYDMCKAVDKGMVLDGTRVVEKVGGKSGDWKEEGWVEWSES